MQCPVDPAAALSAWRNLLTARSVRLVYPPTFSQAVPALWIDWSIDQAHQAAAMCCLAEATEGIIGLAGSFNNHLY